MAQMIPQKHNISEFNSGNEYGTQGIVAEDFTNLVENTTYANETIESLDGGTYSSSVSYKFPSIVNDSNGASYMAIYKVGGDYQSFSNVAPPNATYWKALGSTSPEYTIAVASTTTGYAKSYELLKDNTPVGVKIDIPKDMVISNAEIKTVTQNNVPYQGAVVGDKYIDFTIANATSDHLYLPVNDLVDVYTAGNGLNLTNGKFSVKVYGSSANGLSVSANGLELALATTSSAGAMSSSDKSKLDGLNNSNLVHKTNNETVDGVKTFTQNLKINNDADISLIFNKLDDTTKRGQIRCTGDGSSSSFVLNSNAYYFRNNNNFSNGLRIIAGSGLFPETTNLLDVGSNTKSFKNGYFNDLNCGTVTVGSCKITQKTDSSLGDYIEFFS